MRLYVNYSGCILFVIICDYLFDCFNFVCDYLTWTWLFVIICPSDYLWLFAIILFFYSWLFADYFLVIVDYLQLFDMIICYYLQLFADYFIVNNNLLLLIICNYLRWFIWKNDMKEYPGISRDNPIWCLSRDNPG